MERENVQEGLAMTPEQVEEQVLELIHRESFYRSSLK